LYGDFIIYIACSGFDFDGVRFCANTDLGTLSATDADAGDTFTYTLENNSAAYIAIDGNTLKLAKTVDYETTKNLNITVRVTDANSHTFSKNFTFDTVAESVPKSVLAVVFSVILRLPVKVMAVGVSSLRLARLTVMVCSAFLSSTC
jgi:hypothetical protein